MIHWIKNIFNRKSSTEIPEGWTDDMSIPLPPEVTEDKLVDKVINAALKEKSNQDIESLLVDCGLSSSDAELARDRIFGGIFRAGTIYEENCPDKIKDPLAWLSYMKAKQKPELIGRIFPEFLGDE